MLEAFRHEEIIDKVGGRFRLTSLIQKRWKELMFGARPMVDPAGKSPLEIVMAEIVEGKIGVDTAKADDAAAKA